MATEQTRYRPTQVYTEEKAIHLVRVFMNVLSIMFLLAWQHIVLLNPLKRGKAEMEHMDPSEIVATPMTLDNVAAFTMTPVVVLMIFWLYRAPRKFSSNMVTLTKLTLVTYALFALCGDNMVKNWKHSILTATYIGALVCSTATGSTSTNIMDQIPFTDFSNLMATARLYCMLLFSIPFQVLAVLDKGVQIQRWPLPILLGGTYGYVIGTVIGLLLLYRQNSAQANKKNKD